MCKMSADVPTLATTCPMTWNTVFSQCRSSTFHKIATTPQAVETTSVHAWCFANKYRLITNHMRVSMTSIAWVPAVA